MPILCIESQYPPHKNKEALETWLGAIQKYPRPEGLFTKLIDTAIGVDKIGFLKIRQPRLRFQSLPTAVLILWFVPG